MFELLTVQLKLRVMQGHRLKARQTLDYLEHVALGLHSPLYTGQLFVARGDFMAPVDKQAEKAAHEAALELFDTHGYRPWQTAVEERLGAAR